MFISREPVLWVVRWLVAGGGWGLRGGAGRRLLEDKDHYLDLQALAQSFGGLD